MVRRERGGREGGGGGDSQRNSEGMMIALHSLQVVATAQPPHIGPEFKPNDYLVFSILTTIFCCWLIGLIAIIYSVRVSTKVASTLHQAHIIRNYLSKHKVFSMPYNLALV